jgi:hypothetical protein
VLGSWSSDWALWNRKIERDVDPGKLDNLAEKGASRSQVRPNQAVVMHHASPSFWICYRSLPEDVRKLADQAFAGLKQDRTYISAAALRVLAVSTVGRTG